MSTFTFNNLKHILLRILTYFHLIEILNAGLLPGMEYFHSVVLVLLKASEYFLHR